MNSMSSQNPTSTTTMILRSNFRSIIENPTDHEDENEVDYVQIDDDTILNDVS